MVIYYHVLECNKEDAKNTVVNSVFTSTVVFYPLVYLVMSLVHHVTMYCVCEYEFQRLSFCHFCLGMALLHLKPKKRHRRFYKM